MGEHVCCEGAKIEIRGLQARVKELENEKRDLFVKRVTDARRIEQLEVAVRQAVQTFDEREAHRILLKVLREGRDG